ncbi:type II toxin-antitoxin system CcdA family antitoxin [Sphingomonas sp. RB1R13]|uniref:type II toxin-antitoxin system CcdA family antitoxin n=1 Tax=Sphingomonas sp. RB1R13 TaxID=3096159 RepID=UPI002FC762E5
MASRSHRSDPAASRKRATNVSLSEALVAEAKQRGINVSRSCEEGLARAVKARREAEWLAANRVALESNHSWIETNGIPLSQFRKF